MHFEYKFFNPFFQRSSKAIVMRPIGPQRRLACDTDIVDIQNQTNIQ
jgi:hypothetical protein